MSFSSEVKEELSRRIPEQDHCSIAELSAMIGICGQISISEDDQYQLIFQTENVAVARKYFTLLKKTFNIEAEIRIRKNTYLKKVTMYRVIVAGHEDTENILRAARYIGTDGEITEDVCKTNCVLLQDECCRQAYIRGIFLAAGSICDPEKSYHLEMTFTSASCANQVQGLICGFGLEAKAVIRKNHTVIYMKDGFQITKLLDIMGAGASIMSFEGVRMRREISNKINRQVNCETANLSKTVQAAMKQIEDIRYIETQTGFAQLSDGLRKIAVLRLQYQDASLKELGLMLDPPVGKSGVNHRLHKLSEIAQELRREKGGEFYD